MSRGRVAGREGLDAAAGGRTPALSFRGRPLVGMGRIPSAVCGSFSPLPASLARSSETWRGRARAGGAGDQGGSLSLTRLQLLPSARRQGWCKEVALSSSTLLRGPPDPVFVLSLTRGLAAVLEAAARA